MRTVRRFSMLACAVLAGCGGSAHAGVPLTVASAAPQSGSKSMASLTITIPKPTAASAAHRSPRYVSTATQSMTVLVTNHTSGATVLNETVGLTTTSTGCASTLASTQCTVQLPLAPGTYNATIATYDGYDSVHNTATGSELSQGQTVNFTIQSAVVNTIALTLSGIPTAMKIFSSTANVFGSQSSGFSLYGPAAQPMLVEAFDADGNIIVGAGSPTFAITSSAGNVFTITNPTTASPNRFTLTPPSTPGSSETFTATASFGDQTCAIAGTVCSTSFIVAAAAQSLFVANDSNSNVTEYAFPYTSTPATLATSVSNPAALAKDALGDVFVANAGGGVSVFPSPYSSASFVVPTNGDYPQAILVTPSGTLIAVGEGTIFALAPPYSGTPTGYPLPNGDYFGIQNVAVDHANNVYVGDPDDGAVDIYAPPYTSPPTVIPVSNVPYVLLIDGSGNLFVAGPANYTKNGGTKLVVLAPPYTGTPTATIAYATNNPIGLAINSSGDLMVANLPEGGGSINIYAPPYTAGPIVTLSNNLNGVNALVVDLYGNLFATARTTVQEFAPPYTGSPTVISNGLAGPDALLLLP